MVTCSLVERDSYEVMGKRDRQRKRGKSQGPVCTLPGSAWQPAFMLTATEKTELTLNNIKNV